MPIHTAVERSGTVEAGNIRANTQSHAKAFTGFTGGKIAGRASHSGCWDVFIQQCFVVAEAAGGKYNGMFCMYEALFCKAFVNNNANNATVVILNKRYCGALEFVIHAFALTIGEHRIGCILHFQHVMIESRVFRSYIDWHFAQAPLHTAVCHPIK